MALINCSECNTEISDKAAACPRCGAPVKPIASTSAIPQADKKSSAILKYGGGFLIGCLALSALSLFLIPKATTAPDGTPLRESDGCAKSDLKCIADPHLGSAFVSCQRPIELQAKYSVRWIDQSFTPKFSRYRWRNVDKGEITLIGDSAEFQNGFGAYVPVIYECDITSDMQTVLEVRTREGRLPQ